MTGTSLSEASAQIHKSTVEMTLAKIRDEPCWLRLINIKCFSITISQISQETLGNRENPLFFIDFP